MKKILELNLLRIFTLIILIFGTNNSFGQKNNAIASCCEGEGGRCTGSSNCSACTNCSRCKYCNSGGSCGVCSGGSRRTYTPTYTPKRNTYYSPSSPSTSTSNYNQNNKIKTYLSNNNLNSTEIYDLPNDINSEYYLKTLMVNTLTLNLRKGPSTSFDILERLSKYQELVLLAMIGDWVKVRVKSTNTTGFVHYKYIVVLTK
ncbi:SH3 domain-containing protein [Flavivirga sp. 57AJ16]|uniref:SH3 domain-containing protein n=1 Tax=Flavivirga sp. 57AJ16 TaxID=3025307 RepID=UPI0023673EAC|nr:SH3 domain-containing protein [Flavivirga sp. 57AJ16]MDD7885053.1 SH3 domain-containing protein [Flavivirga sp. 57AJ16]